ncbi:putative hydrolases of HD superfamily [Maridesulfovibrio ferrireducens]|uniref:Putative hydrolases of HD superfamily n=1 Tax=Maridesulfovibrio ferrireducens TaxID=246191 RepID=A0A1G9AVK8_9BACT|nr:HD domain-containing protein [Maridesulfovibrio ferrireducens]SDK31277.1 putative hydrolases of HD superfamily [Maridesulfovibrio ferrireducens]
MPNIRKSLLQLIFSGSFMKRWNDKLRPMELVEVDKQAHKMIAAWILFTLNSEHMDQREKIQLGNEIVEGGIFEYLFRMVITDIKPPVFYRIKENPEHYRKLSEWVLKQLRPRLMPLGLEFWERLKKFHLNPDDKSLSARILAASHMYASYSEFKLLKHLNQPDDELLEIEDSFRSRLESYSDLKGTQELLNSESTALGRFADLCGRLRFQTRWSQTPRIPETSVLGHVYIVATYAWFFSLEIGACPARRQNNFFTGLFHDLPELLTRDIISPVKKADPTIGDLIKEYEDQELESKIMKPLINNGYESIASRLGYFLGSETGSEFQSAAIIGGFAKKVTTEELDSRYNDDCYDPRDGELLKLCDHLSAFMEAYNSLQNGITSASLQQAYWRISQNYMENPVVAGIHVGPLLADFD